MRIAFIVEKFPTLTQTFIFNQIDGLRKKGHEIDIYAWGGPSRDVAQLEQDKDYRPLLKRTYYYGLRIPARFFIPLMKGMNILSSGTLKKIMTDLRSLSGVTTGGEPKHFRFLTKALFWGKRKSYDIVHCQFGNTALRILEHRRRGFFRGPLVTTFRGGDISRFLIRWGREAYAPLFQEGDFFLANCEHFKRCLIELGCPKEKTAVLGSGIDLDRFFFRERAFPHGHPLQIATTARLVPKKGLEYSIRAVAQLLERYPSAEYKIIGDGELRKPLEELISGLNMKGRIQILGQRHPDEVAKILDRSHLFIASSITTPDGNEDAPVNTLKEAMAMGLPVVATRHGGIPELVEDGVSGHLVPENDPNAITEKLELLIQQSNDWPRMGTAGRKQVERCYDMEKLNDELLSLYTKLVGVKG